MCEQEIMPVESLQKLIFTIRGVQVMVDSDLAIAYGVENKRLNEQVKRNTERFPAPFRFQLTLQELDELAANCKWLNLKSQIATSSGHGGRRHLPYVFLVKNGLLFQGLKKKLWRCWQN